MATSHREDVVVSCWLLQFLGADGCVAMSEASMVGACALGSVTFVGMLALIRPVRQARYASVASDGVMS